MAENKIEHNPAEQIVSPDNNLEQSFERGGLHPDTEIFNPISTPSLASHPISTAPKVIVDNYRDEKLKAIETILEEDLADLFIQLPDASKQDFKKEGEITAKRINALMAETKVAVQRIVELIRNWLSTLPGVNKFFIEQEAKIKTDKIIAIK